MNGLRRSLRSTGRMYVLRVGESAADVKRLWVGLLLLLGEVGEGRGVCFGGRGRNCWRRRCVLLVSLCRRLRVRERSCEWQSCEWSLVYKEPDAGEAWGAEKKEAAEAAA